MQKNWDKVLGEVVELVEKVNNDTDTMITTESTVEHIVKVLSDIVANQEVDVTTRRTAVQTLGKVSHPLSTRALIGFLYMKDVSKDVLDALMNLGGEGVKRQGGYELVELLVNQLAPEWLRTGNMLEREDSNA